ncbi:hypothetical protein HK405_004322 [Cladochytrium tenue]|nr:hypothetical protein HK405_004322 [Cladochytrium tenue]
MASPASPSSPTRSIAPGALSRVKSLETNRTKSEGQTTPRSSDVAVVSLASPVERPIVSNLWRAASLKWSALTGRRAPKQEEPEDETLESRLVSVSSCAAVSSGLLLGGSAVDAHFTASETAAAQLLAPPDCLNCQGTQFLTDGTACRFCSEAQALMRTSSKRSMDIVLPSEGLASAPLAGRSSSAKRQGSRIARAVGHLRRRSSIEIHPDAKAGGTSMFRVNSNKSTKSIERKTDDTDSYNLSRRTSFAAIIPLPLSRRSSRPEVATSSQAAALAPGSRSTILYNVSPEPVPPVPPVPPLPQAPPRGDSRNPTAKLFGLRAGTAAPSLLPEVPRASATYVSLLDGQLRARSETPDPPQTPLTYSPSGILRRKPSAYSQAASLQQPQFPSVDRSMSGASLGAGSLASMTSAASVGGGSLGSVAGSSMIRSLRGYADSAVAVTTAPSAASCTPDPKLPLLPPPPSLVSTPASLASLFRHSRDSPTSSPTPTPTLSATATGAAAARVTPDGVSISTNGDVYYLVEEGGDGLLVVVGDPNA